MYYFDVLSELSKKQVRYLVVGGLALNLLGVPRTTQDIDIFIGLDKENILQTINVLKKLGYIPRVGVVPEDLADPIKRDLWVNEKNMKAFSFFHKKDTYKVVDIVLVSSVDFSTAQAHKVIKYAKGISVPVMSIEDLITMKEKAGRAQDISDVVLLRKVLHYWQEREHG